MRASHRKTLSSAFIITAVVVVFCLTATSCPLAQDDLPATKAAASCPKTFGQAPEPGAASVEPPFPWSEYEFRMLLGLIALAAFLRARIEWIKRQCKHTKTHRAENVLPSAIVETIFAIAGFLLVLRIYMTRLGGQSPACLDCIILVAIALGFAGLFVLLVLQWNEDIDWMFGKREDTRSESEQPKSAPEPPPKGKD